MIYEFAGCTLDTEVQELRRDGEPVHVEPQVFAVLQYLVEHHDRVVTKIELLDNVWGDRFVSESALTSRVKLARRACGDTGREQAILKTVHGRGYRVVAEIIERSAPTTTRPAPRDREPRRSAVGTVVGREDELATLDEMLTDVAAGGRRSAFLTGPMGSGKSTLVAELFERNEELDDWYVLRGHCLQSRSGAEPYFCLLDALGTLAGEVPDVVRSVLDRVAPSWLVQLPMLVDDERWRSLERRLLGAAPQRMLREGAAAFEELARHRPVLLVLEGLQWADDCTLDVVELLVDRSAPVPLALLGIARAERSPITALIASATAAHRADEVRLGPLDRAAVAALVAGRLGPDPIPEELLDLVVDRSGGSPLFAHEIVGSWIRDGLVTTGPAGVAVAAPIETIASALPTTLPPIVAAELDGLGPDDTALLETAAVIGFDFDAAAVAAGLERPLATVEAAFATLARGASHIEARGRAVWPDGTISTSFSFTHPLFCDVVGDRIPAGRRAELHGRIGRALESAWGERAGELAMALADHFVAAGDEPRAVEYLRRAGEQAAGRDAHEHAARLLREALERTTRLPAGPDRDRTEIAVRVALGPVLVATHGWIDPEVRRNYERAVELGTDSDTGAERAAARYGLATVTELRGEFGRTETLLTPLVDGADLTVEALELLACSTFHQGDFQHSIESADRVLRDCDDDEDRLLMARIAEHPTSSCHGWLALSCWFVGRSDEALAHATRAVEIAEARPYALSTALQQRAMLHQLRREPGACVEWAERTRAVGGEQGFPMRVIQADIYKGWALGVTGDTTTGGSLLADGIGRFRDAGARLNEPYYLALEAEVLIAAGEHTAALARLDEALAILGATTRSYFYEAEIHRFRGRALAATDDPAAAAAAIARALEVAERCASPVLTLRAVAERLRIDGDPASSTRLAGLVGFFADQAPTPDVEDAQQLLGVVEPG